MSSITREDIYDADLNEEQRYNDAIEEEQIPLPLTKLGFEALLKRVTDLFKLPYDDASRCVLAGYIHHIPNEENATTLNILGAMLHKSVANATSWRVDQEVKERRKKEAEEQKQSEDAVTEKKDDGDVVSLPH